MGVPPSRAHAPLLPLLRRQWPARLFAGHVLGVPAGPILIALAESLLMLTVGGLRAAECGCEIRRRCECHVIGVHAARQSIGDFLKQPAVAIGIFERGPRSVA